MKIVVTGFSGFVARHFIQYLYNKGNEAEILGIDINEPLYDYESMKDTLHIQFQKVDLLNATDLRHHLESFVPEYVLHLASYSSVAYSWKYPAESFKNNTNIFLNLVSTIKDINKECRILSVGSSEEYGNVEEIDLPLRENHTLMPVSPYAVARVSQEMLSKVYCDSYDMNIVLTRSFNHIGPYQDERFVVPSFIKRILTLAEAGKQEGMIETGDISIIRDFVDVRDVVHAYYLLLMSGTPGEIYNICSGSGVSLKTMIDMIARKLQVEVKTQINPEYVRPNDNKIMIGSAQKITEELGWKPQISLENTLSDMIEIMRES